jgi:putative endonuclease
MENVFYVYVLKSPKSGALYYGFSSNLRQRFAAHQAMPKHAEWMLVYYEAYSNEQEARDRERQLKTVRSRERSSRETYNAQPFQGAGKCWVMACLLLNESASYCQWRA